MMKKWMVILSHPDDVSTMQSTQDLKNVNNFYIKFF